jgi:hypothetical protein
MAYAKTTVESCLGMREILQSNLNLKSHLEQSKCDFIRKVTSLKRSNAYEFFYEDKEKVTL